TLTSVVYHELTHYFIGRALTVRPTWLNEGLSEYFAVADIRDDAISLGGLSSDRMQLFKTATLLPLKDFFAVDSSSPYYNETPKARFPSPKCFWQTGNWRRHAGIWNCWPPRLRTRHECLTIAASLPELRTIQLRAIFSSMRCWIRFSGREPLPSLWRWAICISRRCGNYWNRLQRPALETLPCI